MRPVFLFIIRILTGSVFLLAHGFSQGQVLHGKVIDKASGQVLPYASFGIYGRKVGGIADRDGNFSIDLSHAERKDSLVFTYVGYSGCSVLATDLDPSKELTIGLTPTAKGLPEVAVARKRKIIEVGNVKFDGYYTGWGDYSSSRGRLRGLVIALGRTVNPVAFVFHVRRNTFDSVKVRLHILAFQGDSLPVHELLQDNVYVTIPKSAQWVNIDLVPYHLVVRDTIVVAVEWVDAWAAAGVTGSNSHLFTFSDSHAPGVVYTRDFPLEAPTFIRSPETPAMYLRVYRVGNGQ